MLLVLDVLPTMSGPNNIQDWDQVPGLGRFHFQQWVITAWARWITEIVQVKATQRCTGLLAGVLAVNLCPYSVKLLLGIPPW